MTSKIEHACYGWRVYVYLAGDTRMHLCSCQSADAAAAIIRTLTGADRPQYTRIELEAESDFSPIFPA